MWLAVDKEIAGEPCRVGLPGDWGIGIEIDPGEHVVRMRALAYAAHGRSREARAAVHRFVEVGDGPPS